ncbi:hypothetical protein HY095_02975 [Candidatus Micrarchaeota archaeon]|nr:hypothetical protein [Candidatus Micrarchaeota archaeon]
MLDSLRNLLYRLLAPLGMRRQGKPAATPEEARSQAAKNAFAQDLAQARIFLERRPAKAQGIFLTSLHKNAGVVLGLKYEFTFEELCRNLNRKKLDSDAKKELKQVCDEINEQLYAKERLPPGKLAEFMDRMEGVFPKL